MQQDHTQLDIQATLRASRANDTYLRNPKKYLPGLPNVAFIQCAPL